MREMLETKIDKMDFKIKGKVLTVILNRVGDRNDVVKYYHNGSE